MARVTWKSDAGSGNLGTSGNWSTASVPSSSDVALFREGSVSVTAGSLTTSGCYFSESYTGDFGSSSFDVAVDVTRDQVLIDKPVGRIYGSFGTTRDKAAVVIIRRLPPSSDHLITVEATRVVVIANNEEGRRPYDFVNLKGTTQDLFVVNRSKTPLYVSIDALSITSNFVLSGSVVVESTGSAITGKFVCTGGSSDVRFGDGDSLQNDSYISGGHIRFDANNLSASNNVEISSAKITVTNTQSAAFAIGDVSLNPGSEVILDCPVSPTAGSFKSYGGVVTTPHPNTFALTAYGTLSSTTFRSLAFNDAQNSGHFQTGIMA